MKKTTNLRSDQSDGLYFFAYGWAMGIKYFLQAFEPERVAIHHHSLKAFRGKRFAIDAAIQLYQASSGLWIGDTAEENPNFLRDLIARILKIDQRLCRRWNITTRWVFDGEPFPLKSATHAIRADLKAEQRERYEDMQSQRQRFSDELCDRQRSGEIDIGPHCAELRERIDGIDKWLERHRQTRVHIEKSHVEAVHDALEKNGAHVENAPHEAEQWCAWLCFQGEVDYAVSKDWDCLVYGAPRILKGLSSAFLADDDTDDDDDGKNHPAVISQRIPGPNELPVFGAPLRRPSFAELTGQPVLLIPALDLTPLPVDQIVPQLDEHWTQRRKRRRFENPMQEIHLVELLKVNRLTYDQFVDVAIMCRCDAIPHGLPGYGGIKAKNAIRKYGSLELFMETDEAREALNKLGQSHTFPWREARQEFLSLPMAPDLPDTPASPPPPAPAPSAMKPKTVFISGHTDLKPDEFARHYEPAIRRAVEQGCSFVVGDALGADYMAQTLLSQLVPQDELATRVTVYHKNDSPFRHAPGLGLCGGFPSHPKKDGAMTAASDEDILWVRPAADSQALYGAKYDPKRISGTERNHRRRLAPAKKKKAPEKDMVLLKNKIAARSDPKIE